MYIVTYVCTYRHMEILIYKPNYICTYEHMIVCSLVHIYLHTCKFCSMEPVWFQEGFNNSKKMFYLYPNLQKEFD